MPLSLPLQHAIQPENLVVFHTNAMLGKHGLQSRKDPALPINERAVAVEADDPV